MPQIRPRGRALFGLAVLVAFVEACTALRPPETAFLTQDKERIACFSKTGADGIAGCTEVLNRPDPYRWPGMSGPYVQPMVFAIRGGVALQLARHFLSAGRDEDALTASAKAAELFQRYDKGRIKTPLSPGMRTQIDKDSEQLSLNVAQARYTAGIALIKLHRWEKAAQELREAVELDASHTGAWASLGVAFNQIGNYAESQRAFERVVVLEPAYFNEARAIQKLIFEASVARRTFILRGTATKSP